MPTSFDGHKITRAGRLLSLDALRSRLPALPDALVRRKRHAGGRPRSDGDGNPVPDRVSVRLTREERAFLRAVGNGNMSEGVRLLAEQYMAEHPDA